MLLFGPLHGAIQPTNLALLFFRTDWISLGGDCKIVTPWQVFLGFTVKIIKRTEAAFVVLPRRWVVERTFGWNWTQQEKPKELNHYAIAWLKERVPA